MRPLTIVSVRYAASHVAPSRTCWNVSEPSSGTTDHSIAAPLATKPPRLHWNRNGIRRLMSTWKNRTRGKCFEARK